MAHDSVKKYQHEIGLLAHGKLEGRFGGLVQLCVSNNHIPLLAEFAKVMMATYRVHARFTRGDRNGTDWIYVGGRVLLQRPNKRGGIQAGEGVEIVEHQFSPYGGGSNQYPVLTYEIGATCELTFVSIGLPELSGSSWKMEILSLHKIGDYAG